MFGDQGQNEKTDKDKAWEMAGDMSLSRIHGGTPVTNHTTLTQTGQI